MHVAYQMGGGLAEKINAFMPVSRNFLHPVIFCASRHGSGRMLLSLVNTKQQTLGTPGIYWNLSMIIMPIWILSYEQNIHKSHVNDLYIIALLKYQWISTDQWLVLKITRIHCILYLASLHMKLQFSNLFFPNILIIFNIAMN